MLLLLLGYKVRNLSKFTCFGPNLWSFLVHFSPFFCSQHPTQLRKAHRRELATWCTTYCCKVFSVSNQTISTVGHGIDLFQISRIIGLQKKFREACFHVRYRTCSSAANLCALLFRVDFPLSNSQRKFVREYKIISWWIQGHFKQFLNLCRAYCLANTP